MKKKRCIKCKKTKLANTKEFSPHKETKDKLCSYCRECKRKIDRVYSRKYREEHPEWKKKDNKRNLDLQRKLIRQWQKDNPRKFKAQSLVNSLKAKHKLEWDKCVYCGTDKNVVAHHPNYDNLYEVVFLCQKHHKRLHAEIIELDEDKYVIDIRELVGVAT